MTITKQINLNIEISDPIDPRWSNHTKTLQNALHNLPPVLIEVLDLTQSHSCSLKLGNDRETQELNSYFRAKDKPTNILSFPTSDGDYLGDMIMAVETLEREAKEQDKSFEAHFTHLLIHGILHLVGYNHITDQDAEEMEGLEVEILQRLNFANPYI